MMKPIIILIFLNSLFTWNTSYGQQVYFNNRYDYNNSEEVIWSIIEVDSGYICAAGTGEIVLVGLDTLGNKIWEKAYGIPGSYLYAGLSGSLIQTLDGGFALGGSINTGMVSNAMLWRFDKNMDTLWTKTYGYPVNDQIGYQCKQTVDGGFVIIGVTNQVGNDDILLIKTDSLGDMEWDRTYGGGGGLNQALPFISLRMEGVL